MVRLDCSTTGIACTTQQFGEVRSRDPIGYVDGVQGYEYTVGNPISRSDFSGLFKTNVVGTSEMTLCGGIAVTLSHELEIPTSESIVAVQKICSPKYYAIERCRVEGGLSVECGCAIYDSWKSEMPEDNCHYEWFAARGGKFKDVHTRKPRSDPDGCSSQGERYDTISIRVFKTEDVAVELLQKFKYQMLLIKAGCGYSATAWSEGNERAFSPTKPDFWDKATPVAKEEVEIYVNWQRRFSQRKQFAVVASNGTPIWNQRE